MAIYFQVQIKQEKRQIQDMELNYSFNIPFISYLFHTTTRDCEALARVCESPNG